MSFVLTPIATDNFTPNASPLNPANWTVFTDATFYGSMRAHSGVAESTTATFNAGLIGGEYYVGASIPANQYVTAKLANWTIGNASEADLFLRSGADGDDNYFFDITDNGDGITAEIDFGWETEGSLTGLYFNYAAIVNQGDVFTFGITGYTLFAYQNGVLLAAVQDPSRAFSSGYVGLMTAPAVSASDTAWSNFVTGSVASIAVVPPGPTSVWSPDSITDTRDYFHFVLPSGLIVAWYDYTGTLNTAGSGKLPAAQAASTIVGDGINDFLEFTRDYGGNKVVVAWITGAGALVTSGSPQRGPLTKIMSAPKSYNAQADPNPLTFTNSTSFDIGVNPVGVIQ